MRSKKAVFFGELLLRLTTNNYDRFIQAREFDVRYTGAEANAAVSAANYGLESYVVSAVPGNEIGQACINYIRQYGVNTDHVIRSGEKLGILYVEPGASQRPSKVIYDRKGSSFAQLENNSLDWDEIFKDKDWFHFSGTAPALSDSLADIVLQACVKAKEHGLKVSCDLNYRKNLWTPDKACSVMTGLMKYVDLLIGNEEDADKVFGIKAKNTDVTSGLLDAKLYNDVADILYKKFDFEYVVITLRESISASDNGWSALLYDGKEYNLSRKYMMHIVDRVGGGDSFSGAIIYALLSGYDSKKAIEFASAASCLKHSIPGDFNLVTVEEVNRLLSGDSSGRVQR
jgi:2-dehydro-3-deoxygluconokinase